jgi:hypothetical protein
MRHRTTTTALALAAAGLLLAGCSSGTSGTTPATTSTSPPMVTARTPFKMPSHSPEPLSTLATDPDTAACYKAIKDQYEPGTITLTGAPAEPPACQGLTTDQVSEIATAVIGDQLGG